MTTAVRLSPIQTPRASMNFRFPIPNNGASNHGVSGAGAAVSVTLDADTNGGISLAQIFASYSAAPAAGAFVLVEDGAGGTVLFKQYMPTTAGNFTFDPPISGTKNTAMVITLSAPGGAIVGLLDVNAFILY
jgi:hypothetical protein